MSNVAAFVAFHRLNNSFGCSQVKCWQIRRQTKAPQAAGAIHTDFERGFICAEVSS